MNRYIVLLLNLFLITSLNSIEFKYKWDDSYRLESVVYQNVKINRNILGSSTILNKYAVEVLNSSESEAKLEVTQSVFQQIREYTNYYTNAQSLKGEVLQDRFGTMTPITNSTFPTVQNVPSFPDRDVKVGESWQSMAIEHFDLNNGFGINDTISTKFRVFYTYSGNTVVDGIELAIIDMNYNFFERITPYLDWGDEYPVKLSGGSRSKLLWDIKNGRTHSAEDSYFFEFIMSTGDKIIYTGVTETNGWPKNNLDGQNMVKLIDELKTIPQTTVENFDDHVTITFNSLLFGPESWYLKEEVKEYLDKIGSTLKSMGDVNIKISGHTAIFGEADGKYLDNLSLNRANSVADYLVENNFLDKYSIEVLGYGGDKPVDTNSTKLGRSRNRRVEIDILKN